MAKLRRLPWVDIALVVILVLGGIITFSASQAKSNSEQVQIGLETRRRAVELDLGEARKGATLESLSQSLEQARSALAKNTLPAEADALAVTAQILQYAKENNITITRWDSSYTSIALQGRTYSAISHNLNVEGKADNLISFSEALAHASIAPVVQDIKISGIEGESDRFHIDLELLVYYR
ncbi:MAG: hypothetical protein HY528_03425 [Chloroflexi bacterium]|nr:hypothetical protein [Chloroflexota bacterium]